MNMVGSIKIAATAYEKLSIVSTSPLSYILGNAKARTSSASHDPIVARAAAPLA